MLLQNFRMEKYYYIITLYYSYSQASHLDVAKRHHYYILLLQLLNILFTTTIHIYSKILRPVVSSLAWLHDSQSIQNFVKL